MNARRIFNQITYSSMLAFLTLLANLSTPVAAVTVLNMGGEALDTGSGTTSVTTTTPFDIMGGSTLVVTLSAESSGFPGGTAPPGASATDVLFGNQMLTLAGVTVNGGGSPATQVTEIWYLDNPFDTSKNITVNWDPGNGSGVGGTGIGFVSLNEVLQGGPSQFASSPLSEDVAINVPNVNSFVIASSVTNGAGGSLTADAPLTELYSGGVGSADGSAGFSNGVGAGIFEAMFSGGSISRPTSSAAAFDTGPSIAPTPEPVPGDLDGDSDVDITEIDMDMLSDFDILTSSLGATGLEAGQGPDLANSDGVVDFRDLRAFQQDLVNFSMGMADGDLQAAAIPEPSTTVLACAIAALLTGSRVRKSDS